MTRQRSLLATMLAAWGIMIVACSGVGNTTASVSPEDSHVDTQRSPAIPGLTAVDVHGNLTSKGFTLTKDLGSEQSVWRCVDETVSHKMVVEAFGEPGPAHITMVRATYLNYGTGDTNARATEFLSYVASIPYDESKPAEAREWVARNVGKNVERTINGVNFELIAKSPRARMLIILPVSARRAQEEESQTRQRVEIEAREKEQREVEAKKRAEEAERTREAREAAAKKKAAEDAEKAAGAKLKYAKLLHESGKKSAAIEFCEQLIKSWPDTKAAVEARELLATWKE